MEPSKRFTVPFRSLVSGTGSGRWTRIGAAVALVTLLTAGATFVIHQVNASGNTLHVCLSHDCAYHSIDDAMAHASAGATIAVAPGTYTPASESAAGATTTDTTIPISKAVNLQGAGAGKTIVDVAPFYNGTAADSGVVQIANPGGDVTVSGFTLEGAIANDSTSCCDDGLLVTITDNNAADTITVVNNTFYGDTTLDPQLLGDQEDSIYIYDGNARVNVVHNTFQGVFRAALVEGYLGPVNFTNNDVKGLHGLYDITTTPPTLYYYAEAVFFLVDNNADVTAPQVVRNNRFADFSGEGVAAYAGYPGGLVGVMHSMAIENNDFEIGGIAGLGSTLDSPDIYLRGLGYTSGSLTATISNVTVKGNALHQPSDTGQGTGILLRGDVGSGITIDHNQLVGSGGSSPANGILLRGVASTTAVTITDSLITGYDNGINAVADPGTADAPPLGAVALPAGASVVASRNCIAGNGSFGAANAGPATLNAEANWWGAASGPNTLGADSVGLNVDASNYLTRPAPICSGLHLGQGIDHSAVAHGHGTGSSDPAGRHFRALAL